MTKSEHAFINERMHLFPVSGEINQRASDVIAVIRNIEGSYRDDVVAVDYTDGLSMEFSDWRFSLRSLNTEPLLRLNAESRGYAALMNQMTMELIEIIDDVEDFDGMEKSSYVRS